MNSAKYIIVADADLTHVESASDILKTEGFRVLKTSGGEAILDLIYNYDVGAVFFGFDMGPLSGLDVMRRLQGYRTNIPVVLMMGERTSDLLMYASRLGIAHFLQKPIAPERLIEMARRLLRNPYKGEGAPTIPVQAPTYAPDALILKAIALADANAKSGKGGPYGAVVADADGRILGEGVNAISVRHDPTAHAEVLAIRQATERLKQKHLEGCALYASSEPTAVGRALIQSVGITQVYYGLSHADIGQMRSQENHNPAMVAYQTLARDAALNMYQNWQLQIDKKLD